MSESMRNLIADAKKQRCSCISKLAEEDVLSIWNAVSDFVLVQMHSKKGVIIPNLGTFSFTLIKLDIGNNKQLILQRPVFAVSEKFVQLHALKYNRPFTTSETLLSSLNYAGLSVDLPFNRDTVELCIREVLQTLSQAVSNSQDVEFLFRGVGVLVIKQGNIKMKFFKEFVKTFDYSGRLLELMENRPNTVDSVMTTCTSLGALHRPGTKTLILPKLNETQEQLPSINENPDQTEERPEKLPLPPSRVSNRELIRPHTVEGVSSEELHERLIRETPASVRKSQSQHASDEDWRSCDGREEKRKRSIDERDISTERSSPGTLQAPQLPSGLYDRGSRLYPPSRSLSKHDHRFGKELCHLCKERALKNVPVYLHEENKRKQAEEDAILMHYQQSKDEEAMLLEEVRKNSFRQENQKVAAFNLGVADGVKEDKKTRNTDFVRSYVFQHRPLTPLRFFKQAEYNKALESQVKFRRSKEDREKLDQLFMERLEQVQLAEDLAVQREQFVRAKSQQVAEYQKALASQLRSKKRRQKEGGGGGGGDVSNISLPKITITKSESQGRRSFPEEKIRGRHLPLPQFESDSKLPVFGRYDNNNLKLLEQRERARAIMTEHMESVSEKKKRILLERLNKEKNENEVLLQNKKEMIDLRAKAYNKALMRRKKLEETWKKHHKLKEMKEEEERLRMKDSGMLLLQKMEELRRCGQCQRSLANCGESNLWSESRFLPGSRVMV